MSHKSRIAHARPDERSAHSAGGGVSGRRPFVVAPGAAEPFATFPTFPKFAMFTTFTAFAVLFAAGPAALRAQQAAPLPTARVGADHQVAAQVVDVAPVIDGVLNDEAWQGAPVLSGFVQRDPVEGNPVSQRTEARVLADAEALYVGVWAFDSDARLIIPGENRRDIDLDQSDAISLVFDTYLDRQNGYVFGTTPAGIEFDGQVAGEGTGGGMGPTRQQRGTVSGFNKNWDGSWTVAVHRDDQGWYAEFRIPFSILRYGGGERQDWGFNISRRIRRGNEEAFWSPVSRQFNLYRVSQAGTLTDIPVPTSRSAFATPFVLGSASKNYEAGTGAETLGDIGGDAKIQVGSSLTLDLTVNTDFAQVEVDDAQINLTRFPLFFPEKRPFFLENASTFTVGTPQAVDLFFSRRIGLQNGAAVPILAGGRLTGKVGDWVVGLLNIQTRAANVFDAETGLNTPITPDENFGSLRVFREYGNRTRLGGTFITRVDTDGSSAIDGAGRHHNLTYGIDGRLGIGPNLTLDGYVAGTRTPGLDGDAFAWQGSLEHDSRDWAVSGIAREVGDAFNPEVGFLDRSDYRFMQLRVMRRYRFPEIPWFRELRPHILWREWWDRDWFTQTRFLHIDSHFEFNNGAFFQFPAINFTEEGLREPFEISDGVIVPPGSYRNIDWGFRFYTDKSAPLSIESRIDIGGFYSGTRYGFDATTIYRYQDRFVTEARVAYFDVNLLEGDFETTLVSLKAAYSFTPRIYLQSTLQYLEQTGTFSGNVRFGWLNTAGTGLFIVFNDLERFAFDRREDFVEGPLNRSVIIKYTKQFDLLR